MMTKENLKGVVPESWLCVDCGADTAPGLPNRVEMDNAIEKAKAAGDRRQARDIVDDISDEFMRALDPVRRFTWSGGRFGRRLE